jgi:hypothetical protein
MSTFTRLARRLGVAVLLLTVVALAAIPAAAHVVPYNKDNIITDAEFTDWRSMDQAAIQRFLEGRRGILKNYRYGGKLASQIIAEQASANQINPRVILATLQKEQSLLEDARPSQYKLDWAMGCGVGNSRYKGFGPQIACGAQTLRYWYNNAKPGTSIGGAKPSNKATYSLYKYTPSVSGNRLFWDVWQMYWPH